MHTGPVPLQAGVGAGEVECDPSIEVDASTGVTLV